MISEVIIPNGIKKLEEGTFCGCKNLEKVTLPESIESIGEKCFYNTALKNVAVPENVKIDENAFPDSCGVY